MGFWERLTNGKMRKCVAFRIVKAGDEGSELLFTPQLEAQAKKYLLGKFFYSRDSLSVTSYERKQLVNIPFLGQTKDGHLLFEEKGLKNVFTRFDISPLGETATMIVYSDEFNLENISFITEFKLEE